MVTAPAWGANDQAPGQLKKQVAPVEAPQSAPTAPITTVTTTVPAPKSAAPLEKGHPAKGIVRNQAAASEPTAAAQTLSSSGSSNHAYTHSAAAKKHSTSVATVAPTQTTAKPHRRRHAITRTSTRHPQQRRAVIMHHHRGAGAPAQSVVVARPAAVNAAPIARRGHKSIAANAAKKPAETNGTEAAPLTTISRAADRVVEVIPGAVVLALAGLCALVLVLMIRSAAMERRRSKALANSYGVTVEALATAIEAKDHTTGGHIERVRKLGLLLAREIVPREARDPQMAYGFLLHDIGKLAVPDAILRAPGRLDADDWVLMRRHPVEGVRMLASVPFLDKALDVVRHHHERWDGGGYPDGLRGTEIPLWARIFAVVDALDAITAARPYRAARTYQEALTEIRFNAGAQFDPDVVAALERIDPAEIEPLLEPSQLVDSPFARVADLTPLIPA